MGKIEKRMEQWDFLMARDNVEIIDGFYFGGTDDFLAPKKPNIDWGDVPATPTTSFVGGFGLDNSEKANSQDPLQIDVAPVRQRRSAFNNAMLGIADLFNISSGDPNAYLGQSEERAHKLDELRMKEDPEGYQIDMNRAKLLSQKAQSETDPTRKAIYGREIKKLLPNETQGLDDLTAADFLVGDDKFKQKMQLEQLKGLNALQLQKLKNSGNMDVAALKASSNEDIARLKTDTQREVVQLRGEYQKAISEGNNVRALQVQQMIDDRMRDLKDLETETKLRQEEMKQEGATGRTAMQQAGQNYRTEYAQNAQFDRNKYTQDTGLEKVRLQQAGALDRVRAQQEGANARAGIAANARIEAAKLGGKKADAAASQDLIGERTSPEMIEKMKKLNQKAGRWYSDYTYGASSIRGSDAAKSYQEFEGMAKQIVQDQLRKIYGAQFTEKEGERFFKSMGLNHKLDPKVRWNLFINQINDLRIKAGLGPVGTNGVVAPRASAPTASESSIVNKDGFITL